jgi:hypothetical protein
LKWLDATVRDAVAKGKKVIVFAHCRVQITVFYGTMRNASTQRHKSHQQAVKKVVSRVILEASSGVGWWQCLQDMHTEAQNETASSHLQSPLTKYQFNTVGFSVFAGKTKNKANTNKVNVLKLIVFFFVSFCFDFLLCMYVTCHDYYFCF